MLSCKKFVEKLGWWVEPISWVEQGEAGCQTAFIDRVWLKHLLKTSSKTTLRFYTSPHNKVSNFFRVIHSQERNIEILQNNSNLFFFSYNISDYLNLPTIGSRWISRGKGPYTLKFPTA